MSDAYDVPLLEVLDSVPLNGRAVWMVSTIESRNIPYGNICQQAAMRIRQLERELAEVKAQHARDEADYNELEADYRDSIAKHVERVEKLEVIIDAHKAMLQKACAELPVSYYPDNTPDKLASNIAGFVKDYTENYRDLEKCQKQLTAHKAALEKCEKALLATWDDLDHLNHWMPTPCRELYMEAKLEIAKLKGNK